MARTDDDSWDITESVGATALGVAAARAADTESDNPLIYDPFARIFLDAVGDGMWTRWSPSGLSAEIIAAEPDLPLRMQAMVDYMASRTVFFDDVFLEAAAAGARQVVILAAGLDARAWRLPWPDDTTVYEIDLPKVLEFKASTLRDHGAQPTARRVDVAIDLRQDWPEALRQAGFDPAAPSVWSAEGLLPFLPATAQDLLFDRIQDLSAAGSWLAVEATGPDFLDPDVRVRQRALTQRYREVVAKAPGGEVPDFDDLWYFEERTDVAAWLGNHGWETTVVTAAELMARCHSRPPAAIEDTVPRSLFVTATKT